MFLFHATSESAWKKIKREGIRPRGTSTGNFMDPDGKPMGSPEMVYLRKDPFPGYAFRASTIVGSEMGVVLEIDVELIDQSLLRVDENFYIVASFGIPYDRNVWSAYWDSVNRAEDDPNWRGSIDKIGVCAYRGIIPPSAITNTTSVYVGRRNPRMLSNWKSS